MFSNSCNSVRAFISVDSNDEIRDMPTNYAVPTNVNLRGMNGMKFADRWDNLSASSESELNNQFFRNPESNLFGEITTTTRWTGTDYDGSVTTQTCSEWTSSANSGRGTIANTAMAGNNYNFIYTGYAAGYPCDATRVLMCICY